MFYLIYQYEVTIDEKVFFVFDIKNDNFTGNQL